MRGFINAARLFKTHVGLFPLTVDLGVGIFRMQRRQLHQQVTFWYGNSGSDGNSKTMIAKK